jgi:hypothetical protein
MALANAVSASRPLHVMDTCARIPIGAGRRRHPWSVMMELMRVDELPPHRDHHRRLLPLPRWIRGVRQPQKRHERHIRMFIGFAGNVQRRLNRKNRSTKSQNLLVISSKNIC